MNKSYPALAWVIVQVKGYGWHAAGFIALSIAFAIASWTIPQLLERFVNKAAGGQFDYLAVALYLGLLALTAVPVLYWCQHRLVAGMGFQLEQRLMQHLMTLDRSFYDRHNSSELTKHLGKGVGGTRRLLFTFSAPSFLVQIPMAAFACWYIALVSVPVVLILVLFMTVYLVIGVRLGKQTAVVEKDENELDTLIMSRREEVVMHVTFLQQQRATDVFCQSLRSQDEKQLKQNHLLIKLYALFNWLAGKVEFLVGILTVSFFLPKVIDGSLGVGTFFALYIYINQVVQPALHWGDIYAQIKSAWAEAEPLVEFFKERPSIVDSENAVGLPTLSSQMILNSVSFAYKGDEGKPVLHDVTVIFPKGKMTAIVGGSGGGKSTIAKLLLRQYDPSVGEVLWDAVPLTQATLSSIHARVAYLPQEAPIFTGTVRENINLRGCHKDNDIRKVLGEAQASFALLPDGLNRPASELSGGEKQRLALARILLQGAEVVVLDEATSALDQVTERGVVETFDQLRQTRGLTQIVIAHRLSTIQHADQIVVMHQGRVAAVGTHEELLLSSDIYQDLMKTFVREA